jgi:hypothetical protein
LADVGEICEFVSNRHIRMPVTQFLKYGCAGVEVTRDLYTPWDEDDAHVGVHRVEPHFVRLPLPGDEVTGLWAEIALDGAVIYDPELVLARELVRIRRSILGGALERRTAGGHSWWSAV